MPHANTALNADMLTVWSHLEAAKCAASDIPVIRHIEQAEDALTRLFAAIPVWQDIGTAPKDGTRLILWDGNRKNRYIGFWDTQKNHRRPNPFWENLCTQGDIMYQRTFPPTLWMHQPTIPAQPDKQGGGE